MKLDSSLAHVTEPAAYARPGILVLVDPERITVIELDTDEILSTHLIDPKKVYWRNQERDPQPLAEPSQARPMTRLT